MKNFIYVNNNKRGIIISNRNENLNNKTINNNKNIFKIGKVSNQFNSVGLPPILNRKIIHRKININNNNNRTSYLDPISKIINYSNNRNKNDKKMKTSDEFWKKNLNPFYENYNNNNIYYNINKEDVKKEVEYEENKIKKEKSEKENIKKINYNNLNDYKNSSNLNNNNKENEENKKPLEKKLLLNKIKIIDKPKETKEEEKNENYNNNNDNNNENNNVNNNDNNNDNNKIKVISSRNNNNQNDSSLLKSKSVNTSFCKDLETSTDEINKNEINDIVSYLNNLDYEKYNRDMEIKEALELLKSKMIKEKEANEVNNKNNNNIEQDNKEETKENISENNNINDNNKNIIEKKEEEKNNNNNINVIIKEEKPIIDENEEKKKEEIEKYRIAEKISKTKKMKAVHSIQSVRKLLAREGLDKIGTIDPLRISIIKENGISKDDNYIENRLPFLHSLPLV